MGQYKKMWLMYGTIFFVVSIATSFLKDESISDWWLTALAMYTGAAAGTWILYKQSGRKG